MTASREIRIEVDDETTVSGLAITPHSPTAAYLFAHGAGAGMMHGFMERFAQLLADRSIATLRYNFAYMENGSRRPDRKGLLHATVRAAAEAAGSAFGDLPLFAGGKSMGGRMTSEAQAIEPLPAVRGIAFVGFPLYPAGKPSTDRAEHLSDVDIPMLFLQGSRDKLAGLDLLEPVVAALGDRATLHVEEGADHGFHVLKRSGRTDAEVMGSMADRLRQWIEPLSRTDR